MYSEKKCFFFKEPILYTVNEMVKPPSNIIGTRRRSQFGERMQAALRGFTREPTLASFTFERKARYPTHGPTDRTAPEATSLFFIRHEIAIGWESGIRRTSTQASGDVRALA